jgi:hypothetical protein
MVGCAIVRELNPSACAPIGVHSRFHLKKRDEIPTGNALDGNLPPNQMKLVQAWIALHADELMAGWERASAGEPPHKIAPLR